MELHEKASAALSWFEEGERKSEDTGRQIRTVPHGDEGPGEWLSDLCHTAHGDMWPDDFRYEMIEDALSWLADEGNDPDDFNPEAPIYNTERLRWLASHLDRAGYCDEAVEEFGRPEGGVLDQIALGWWAEATEVYGLVRQWLEAHDEDDGIRARPEKVTP